MTTDKAIHLSLPNHIYSELLTKVVPLNVSSYASLICRLIHIIVSQVWFKESVIPKTVQYTSYTSPNPNQQDILHMLNFFV